MVVNARDFFKNISDFIKNSVLVKNDSNKSTVTIFGAEWFSPFDWTMYYGNESNRIWFIKKELANYYNHNPKLHYYIVYYKDSTTEEQTLIDEIYNFLVNVGADVVLLEEIEWTWEPPDWLEIVK